MSYLVVVLILGLVVLVHEFGHFLAAKLVGISIQIFSVGFGPEMFSVMKNGTKYQISWIPIGGYVLPAIEDEKEFFKLPVHKRIVMSLGGPIASLVLPIICFSIINLFLHGISLTNLIIQPIQHTFTVLGKFVLVLPTLFTHTENLSGIVGIVSQGKQFIGTNWLNAINFTALLSLNLFVLNLLPIPVLDGGKVILYLLEKIHPKLLKLQYPLAIVGWVFVLGLMLYVTVMDIIKIVM